jgi:hypothetical protein
MSKALPCTAETKEPNLYNLSEREIKREKVQMKPPRLQSAGAEMHCK